MRQRSFSRWEINYDLELLEQHLKDLSPGDAPVIEEYIRAIRDFSKSDTWGKMMMGSTWDFFRNAPAMLASGKWFKVSMQQFAGRPSGPGPAETIRRGSTEREHKHIFKPARVFSEDKEVNSFISLHEEIGREDIISIDNQVAIKNYVSRPDKIIVNGTLKLKVSYVVHLVLDGVVTDFLSSAPVNGAVINVRKIGSHEIEASSSTGKNGRYFFNNLPDGRLPCRGIKRYPQAQAEGERHQDQRHGKFRAARLKHLREWLSPPPGGNSGRFAPMPHTGL